MTYKQLKEHFDIECLYRRVERNLRVGKINPERVRHWVEDTAKATVPQNMSRAQEYTDAIIDHCNRWIDYLVKYPATADDDDYLPNQKVEQLRIEMIGAGEIT
ncbi:hypothetical protein EDD70_1049 [Hydrogenoanaerobacterium saccharovorans]|uniref:Uncharacterized protein n=1 Tax=Hydrogenoanaerobacterium saccharovorans TaxID=474960 RepID=A0A1H8A3D8_9FIRM|nr:hypothetical protein [Hydrogenoanaerobacterium saccharovorans]RPF48234.1 hypothetical protein EDD70_1049 [Hydrogenoanaerobacterium saccharovorans]SEM64358.1 hypothetical protein SAMN05216180_1042 [Hydrogenoanaerobacterium saccharovorans]